MLEKIIIVFLRCAILLLSIAMLFRTLFKNYTILDIMNVSINSIQNIVVAYKTTNKVMTTFSSLLVLPSVLAVS